MPASVSATSRFVHVAIYYRDEDMLVSGLLPFIEQGLELGEPVLVAMPPQNLAAMAGRIGDGVQSVEFVDITEEGRNPARILANVMFSFLRRHQGQRVRIVDELVWRGRSDLEYQACVRHEALVNLALADADAAICCPYDMTHLDPVTLRDAARTHPLAGEPGQVNPSPLYRGALPVIADYNRPLPKFPAHATIVPVDFSALAGIRGLVAGTALASGLSADRAVDLTIAVNELATNTVLHGGGRGELAMWVEDGHIACQVSDSGHIADPLAGRVPPPPDDPNGGRGLLLVHQLCDLVRIHTRPGATSIRALMRR